MSSENVGSEKHWGSLFEKSLNFMRLFNIFLYFKIKLEKNNFLIGCRNRTIIIPNTYLDMCSTFITTYFVFIITTYFFPKPAISNKRVHYCIMHASVIHLCQPFVLFKKIWTERTVLHIKIDGYEGYIKFLRPSDFFLVLMAVEWMIDWK